MFPQVQTLSPFGLVKILESKVIRGIDAKDRGRQAREVRELVVELYGLRMLSVWYRNVVSDTVTEEVRVIADGRMVLVRHCLFFVKHDAVIIYGENVVHIPYGNETLTVESDKGMSQLNVISSIKAREYIKRGCHLFLAHVTDEELNGDDDWKIHFVMSCRVILDFPKVFPDELPRLPLPRQVEFRIDLVLGAAPVARAPYHLEPSEMRELSEQLRELLEKGFIRPSSS
ncbi:hypothetical protein Tco_0892537 [Tanacetum coccineum]|uniref:Reverse transcriptase domain-containing protein n=1 Tax=Tanacetum coccineum TaxID=301880 RepID=A0ABQ5C674_9ASTR